MDFPGSIITRVDCVFLTPFAQQYARNYRSKTEKRLRCFPACCNGHHRSDNFCGQPVIVKVTVHALSSHGHQLHALAEDQIQVVGDFTATEDATTQTDANMDAENVHRGSPLLAQFQMVSPTAGERVYTLNQYLTPWNYPFVSKWCVFNAVLFLSLIACSQWCPTPVSSLPCACVRTHAGAWWEAYIRDAEGNILPTFFNPFDALQKEARYKVHVRSE
jgi:hypothetical protein